MSTSEATSNADSANVKTIRSWYEGWPSDLLDDATVWEVPLGYPGGGVYRGREAVTGQYLAQLTARFTTWEATPSEFLDAGDAVVVTGHYCGVVKATGEVIEVPFTHIWWLKNGKIVRARPASDTSIFTRVFGQTQIQPKG